MKVAIMTQPLLDNYGGLLQAYALKETIIKLGCNPLVINRQTPKGSNIKKILSGVKSKLFGRPHKINRLLQDKQRALISANTIKFRQKYIPEVSQLITSDEAMQSVSSMGISAFVVGSDQCWRPRYSPSITNYFLDFAKDYVDIKRVAYAASFGTADWEFNEKQTQECKKLISLFDAVSVREDDGVTLAKKYLDRSDAVHVLDPTMLLSTADYDLVINQENAPQSKGNLNIYILDTNSEKDAFVQQAASELGLSVFEVMPKKRLHQEKVTDSNVELFQFPCPSQWLKGFQDADFVITDSFHGTVFSILYNKPFIALGNLNRGMSRFQSLLRMFNLESRLVLDLKDSKVTGLLYEKIDWSGVNLILEKERQKALGFLKDSLGA